MGKITTEQKIRVRNYYNRVQYEPQNINKNIYKLFSKIEEYYNPVTDIVTAIINSSVKDLSVENEKINNIVWAWNDIAKLSTRICTEMYLYGEVYVEAILRKNGKIEYLVHNFENIEVEENEHGEIIFFKVQGTSKQYSEKGEEIEVEYSREYITVLDINGDTKILKKEKIGDEIIETPFTLETIPVSKFEFDSTVYECLNIIDKINETESFIRAIFTIHGDPILQANNIEEFANPKDDFLDEISKKEAELERLTLEEARYQNKTIIFTSDEKERNATFKYIELTNPLVKEMQKDIERNKKQLVDLFPELILVDTTTQNVSSDTFEMKNSGLKSKVISFRKSFIIGLVKLDNIALMLMGNSDRVIIDNYKFLDVFKEQDKLARLINVEKMLDILEKITDLNMQTEFETSINEIKKELISDLNALYT